MRFNAAAHDILPISKRGFSVLIEFDFERISPWVSSDMVFLPLFDLDHG